MENLHRMQAGFRLSAYFANSAGFVGATAQLIPGHSEVGIDFRASKFVMRSHKRRLSANLEAEARG